MVNVQPMRQTVLLSHVTESNSMIKRLLHCVRLGASNCLRAFAHAQVIIQIPDA